MNHITSILITSSIVAMLSACKHGGGEVVPDAPVGDISGSWSVSSTVDATACGDGIYVENYLLNVTSQSGNAITYTSNGNSFTGSLSGNKLTSSGSYPENGGTTTGSTTLTIDNVCSSLSGTASWSWTNGVTSCSGTSQVSGTRINSTGCGNVSSNVDAESEPNDAINIANVLTAGVPMQGSTSITSPTIEDDDYYVFTVPVTAAYRFTINYDNSNTLNIALYDTNLTFLISNTSGITSAGTLTTGSVFYIQVDPATASGTVPYTLTVNAI